jgi:putative oxidoreductase
MAPTMTATHPTTTTHRPSRLAALLELLGRVPLTVHLLLFRLAVASVFFKAGMTKWASWESTIALFAEEYKVPVLPPATAAALATTFELGCSTLLALGLVTRLATLPILGQLVVIQLFVYPQAWTEHLVWGSILLLLLTRGAGAISLDRLIGLEPGDHGR